MIQPGKKDVNGVQNTTFLRKKWPHLDTSEACFPGFLLCQHRYQDPAVAKSRVHRLLWERKQLGLPDMWHSAGFLMSLNWMKFCKSSTSLKNIPMFETYPWSIRYSTSYWLLALYLNKGSYVLTWSPFMISVLITDWSCSSLAIPVSNKKDAFL